MGEYAHRQITEVRSAGFHISRRNFSAPITFGYARRLRKKFKKKK